MRIALLSGADKNAGDYLIVHRSKELLKSRISNLELVEFKRNKSLVDSLEEINECDFVVFAGGPGYVPDMYPRRFPLVPNLDDIKPRLFALGMGGYVPIGQEGEVRFSVKTHELLGRIERDGFELGCRDLSTKAILNNNGYDTALFTGCPAWFDLDRVNDVELKGIHDNELVVSISDPARLDNYKTAKALVMKVKEALSPKKIIFVFHRGWESDSFTTDVVAKEEIKLKNWLEKVDVEPVNIAYSHEGFRVYNQCDLHVGFRVHAHLYNLSQRIPSFLIEEDGRGYGANEALGFEKHVFATQLSPSMRRISAATRRLINISVGVSNNMANEIADEMLNVARCEMDAGYPSIKQALIIMKSQYAVICSHVDQLVGA